MKRVPVLDVSEFRTNNNDHRAPIYWGIWGLVLIEAMVFASLVASYFYLRLMAVDWPPAGVKPPELLLPTIGTLVLLVSSFFVYLADTGIEEGRTTRLKLGLATSMLLGLTFLVIKYVEYSDLSYRWNSHAYASIVWTIAGFHTAHVIFLLLKTLVVLSLALVGYWSKDRYIGVRVNGIYWHFVVLLWLPLYAVIYFAPRLLG